MLVATHSPLLVSLPGATLLQLDELGIRRIERYDDLALVQDWRHFSLSPQQLLQHQAQQL